MQKLNKIIKLKKGDYIGLVSPSAPLAGIVKHRTQKSIQTLEKLGFKIIIGSNALKITDYTAGSAQERANDINNMFANKKIKAIITFIGGFHSNQIIEYLDFKLIKKNPKIFIGFSDISVLHFALHTQANLITFYGPAAITQFGEPFGMDEYTKKYFKKAVMSSEHIGKVEPSQKWTDEVLNWFDKKDLEKARIQKPNSGFKWLKDGQCEGLLLGGCITSILHLRSTKYWPNFKGKIFFWELPESSGDITKGEPVPRIDAHLTDLKLSGVFSQIKGMIIGRPKGYTDEQDQQLQKIIIKQTEKYNFPILYNIDIGHTDPIMTLPIGVNAKLNSQHNLFEITESAVV